MLVLAQEAGIGNLFTRRQGSEVCQANINANDELGFRQRFRFNVYREASKPLACTGATDGEGFDRTIHRAMVNHWNTPDLRQVKPSLGNLETEAGLLEGKTVIPAVPLETRIAGLLAALEAPKKCIER